VTRLTLSNVSHSYGPRTIVRNCSLEIGSGEVLGITGDNGSGKSTLVRIMAGILRPTSGESALIVNEVAVPIVARPNAAGFLAPYLAVYEEFTPRELLTIVRDLRGDTQHTLVNDTLDRIGLRERSDDVIHSLSSGWRQRVLLALAVDHEPPLLILDEPSVTLDEGGRRILRAEIDAARSRGAVVILATNDHRDHEACTSIVDISRWH
jgi:heme exporter protein A